ncbi:MAG: hypothetical protein L0Y36_02595 [Planctomycetales bacterium]|nr:hypothetical protein [Planctomycetales bacterium]
MSELDVIRQIARQALTIPTLTGTSDNWLWDRTLRILRTVEHICRLPELANRSLSIDRFCLIAAAYFADSGFAHYTDVENVSARLVLADISLADLCDFSTQVVSDRLAGSLAGPRIDKINRIIVESSNRQTAMTEAMILSDARNLEDMGAVGLFHELRRYVIHGKGISEILESWKRKIDYGYWQARLKESFRFEPVCRLAEQRLSAAVHFMNQLAMENAARDLEERLLGSLDYAQPAVSCEPVGSQPR